MILPDINLLLHAYNSESPRHAPAKVWWETLLNGSVRVGLSWATMLGFIRIATPRHVFANPLPAATACAHVRTWLSQPSVSIVEPGSQHADILLACWSRWGRRAT